MFAERVTVFGAWMESVNWFKWFLWFIFNCTLRPPVRKCPPHFLFGKVSIQPMLPNCCSSNEVQIMQRMAARHSSHFPQLTSTLFLDSMITSLHLFPLPALPNDFSQLSSRCAQNVAEDSFHFPFLKKNNLRGFFFFFAPRLPSHQSWTRARPGVTPLPVLALQRCRSCRWQSTSPGSRWRRSSVWTSTGASASPGAPPGPRRARRPTSELPVSELNAICCVFTMLPNKLPAYEDIDKMIISSCAICTGLKFHFTISPGAIITCRIA